MITPPSNQLDFNFEDKILQLLSPDEIFENADQALLERLVEDKRIERKPANYAVNLLGDYFSMWANTSPEGGLILVGYKNDNDVIGCLSVGQPRLNDIEKCGHIYCPDARSETRNIPIIKENGEQDIALLIRVRYRPDRVVRTVAQAAFIRRGDSKFLLTNEEIRELEIDKGQVDFEREACNLPYPSEFDMDLVRQYVAKYSRSRGLSEEHTNEDILRLTHLGSFQSNRFIPNNACALLFAKDPRQLFPGCKIRFLRFGGETEGTGTKWNAEKDIWVDSGSLPRQIAAIEQVLLVQLREFSRLGGNFILLPNIRKKRGTKRLLMPASIVPTSNGQ